MLEKQISLHVLPHPNPLSRRSIAKADQWERDREVRAGKKLSGEPIPIGWNFTGHW
jgi:hypothetical protein